MKSRTIIILWIKSSPNNTSKGVRSNIPICSLNFRTTGPMIKSIHSRLADITGAELANSPIHEAIIIPIIICMVNCSAFMIPAKAEIKRLSAMLENEKP